MKQYFQQQKGFTLVELMVGLLITTILLSAIFGLLSTSLLSWRIGSSNTEVQHSARAAVEAMVKEIKFARDISAPTNNGTVPSVTIKVLDEDGIHENSVTFKLGTTIGSNPYTLYRIKQKWNSTTPDSAQPLTENIVSDLSFTVTHPRLIEISLTLSNPKGSPFRLDSSAAALNARPH